MYSQICATLGIGLIAVTFEVLRYLRTPLSSYITRKEEEIRERMRDWASKVHQEGMVTAELEDEFWEIVFTYAEDIDEPKYLFLSMRNSLLISGLLFIIASFLGLMPEFEVVSYTLTTGAVLMLIYALIKFVKLDGKIKIKAIS